jgi:hypothetical protein
MPQVGWIINGRKHSLAKVLDYARKYKEGFLYTPEQLYIMTQHYERTYPSPTTIAGCARQSVLRRQTNYYVDIDKAWAAAKGTVTHDLLKNVAEMHRDLEPGALIEHRLSCMFDMGEGFSHTYVDREGVEHTTTQRYIELRGQADKVIPSEKLLVDYKTVKEIQTPGSSKVRGWRAQLSCYRWMLHQHGIEIDRALIHQWHPENPMPLPVEMWPLDKTERYIRARLLKFAGVFEDGFFDVNKGFLPPPLDYATDGDQVWLCQPNGWCAVRDKCFQLIAQGI